MSRGQKKAYQDNYTGALKINSRTQPNLSQTMAMITTENIKREAQDWDEDDEDEVVPKKRTRTKNQGGKAFYYSN